ETKVLKFQELTPEQKELIKGTVAKGATDLEVDLFFHVCNRTGLDPFARQIYAIKRRSQEKGQWVERIVFQIGIEGFRLAAQRSHAKGGPKYEGPTPIQWCDEKGDWTDIWLSEKPPYAARAGVYVEGFREPVYAIAEYKRLVQTVDGKPNIFWDKGHAFQLGKCAEGAAIRKAFPNELSGFYLKEELYDMPEEKDITPPMSIEEHKKALTPPTVEKPAAQPEEGQAAPSGDSGVEDARQPLAGAPTPKGEEIIPPEHRQKVIAHLQTIGLVEMPPPEMTEIESGLLLATKSKKVAGDLLDKMAMSRDTQGKMV
ncbi:hypothetical protein LCGC14_1667290, partial [marine sediment metagenome]